MAEQGLHTNSTATPDRRLTEEQIERTVERRMDALDTRYLSGRLTEGEYLGSVAGLHAWAEIEQTYIAVRARR